MEVLELYQVPTFYWMINFSFDIRQKKKDYTEINIGEINLGMIN
jgi:hypothetical protein